MSESSKTHKAKAPKTLNFGVYICSTSRYQQVERTSKLSEAKKKSATSEETHWWN